MNGESALLLGELDCELAPEAKLDAFTGGSGHGSAAS